jgi:NADH:ubiquinone oxidoreductase subunit 5 (subunit L)/multisubunit Na+/H+ antiporter MnhA subunit/multisubunit Na+/H+ antiporter MnhB subunit
VTEPTALLPLSVALPFAAAGAILALGRRVGHGAGWIVATAAAGSLAALAALWHAPGTPRFGAAWMPALRVELALRADGYGLLLATLVAGIGLLVVLYAIGYLGDEEAARVRRFHAALAAFMGSMLGIALADDLILLFVFWEMTSVTSFLLIGHRFEDEDAKAGALMALQVTALGGIVMSVGFLLVGLVTGTFAISRLAADEALRSTLLASPLAAPALGLILVGAFTKSAQVPFHFWLPRAMAAPTPVSAYLHAATMVKAGVFLLGRMHPLFSTAPLWAPVLVVVGGVSMTVGAVQALRAVDLKAILARTTASTLGAITLGYGVGAVGADSLAILSHALYKGALFLVAGMVEHHAHTRRLDELGGLRPALPLAFVACALAALSMAGFPPLLGWVAKDAAFAAFFESPYLAVHPLLRAAVVAAGLVTGALLVAVAGKLVIGMFLGRPRTGGHPDHAAPTPVPLWPAPLLLALGALGFGLAGAGHLTADVVARTASGVGTAVHVGLVPAPGPALWVSLVALGLGVVTYLRRDAVDRLFGRLAVLPAADEVWERLMVAVTRGAEAYSTLWQNGSLRWYLTATVLAVPAACLWAREAGGPSNGGIVVGLADLPWYGLWFCVLLGIATMIAVTARTRLAAMIATTTIGFLVAMLFVVYRSPDILLTQILIETVSTIFVLLVLVFLPAFRPRDLAPPARFANIVVAGLFGVTVTLLLLMAMTPGLRETDNIATRPGGLLSLALAEGGGQNAVNVIIVDIRAMDTTGEITVLVVVGLCVYGLLRARRGTA